MTAQKVGSPKRAKSSTGLITKKIFSKEYKNAELFNPEDDHWRDQIYYFDGKLSYSSHFKAFLWSGAWLGSYGAAPNEAEFKDSPNEFQYFSSTIDEKLIKANKVPSMIGFRGFFMMDNFRTGEGTSYYEQDFCIEFSQRNCHSVNKMDSKFDVIGRGCNSFGAFILSGEFQACCSLLRLQRQYIADDDQRAKMCMMELRNCFCSN